jgi:sialic acid synthase SpsE
MVVGQLGKAMTLKISNKYIGKSFPTYFIAEAGLNHNGDVNLAKKMIDEAKNANSDAIKFQTYKSENFLTENSKYFDFFKNAELSFEEFKEIKEYADNVGITFLSTPFDFESADYLNKIDVPGFKIASSDVTNLPLIAHIAKMKLPIILSTGLATLDEIDESIKLCHSLQNDQISILHCVADYPAMPEETNLSAMETIREKFCFPVGYSDNGESSLVDEVAVSMGADIIEKHFTLDKKLEGPDHSFSIQPDDLKLLISRIRLIEKIRGNGIKIPSNSEIKNKLAIRKSIFASQPILKGDIFSLKNLAIKRPGNGIEPKHWNDLINKKSTRDINKDELIVWDDFSK